MHIPESDIRDILEWMSSFGVDEMGGITRTLYSRAWKEAQEGLRDKFQELGMETHFDAVGNLIGEIRGSTEPEEVIATGSHVDTVVNAGKLDGQLGIFGGYLAVKYLLEHYGKPKKTIQVVSIAEEEGSRFPTVFWGSKNLLGIAKKEHVVGIEDQNGVRFVDAMRCCGFDFPKEQIKEWQNTKAFIELHIEQGNTLEKENKTIGIIEGIVGQRRYNISLVGLANHAGTTQMQYRKDVIAAFARIVNMSLEKAEKVKQLVLTFGKIVLHPNTVNVVPGRALFTIDCRHKDATVLKLFTEEMEANMKGICEELGIQIEIERWMDELPVQMNPMLISTIEAACHKRDVSTLKMYSGAGHDAQMIAPYVPTGMIFVPSVEGISHNPREWTNIADLRQGIELLAEVLYEMAY